MKEHYCQRSWISKDMPYNVIFYYGGVKLPGKYYLIAYRNGVRDTDLDGYYFIERLIQRP